MPGMTGLDLLAVVRERYPSTHRVMMTAFADVPLAEQSVNHAHIEHFVEKPFRVADVATLVKKLLSTDAQDAEHVLALARAFRDRNTLHQASLRDVGGGSRQ